MKIALAILAVFLTGCGMEFSMRGALDPFPSITLTAKADTTYLLAVQQAKATTQLATQPATRPTVIAP